MEKRYGRDKKLNSCLMNEIAILESANLNYRIRENTTPPMIRTLGDTFWTRSTHVRFFRKQ